MVCTVRRYVEPAVLNSATRSRSVASPPVTAGYTTARTGSSGRASDASATRNRMFSLPVTRRNSATSWSLTRFSARARTRCTVPISRSTSVSVISRCRACSNAASSVNRSSTG